jgi:hypothetical protein
MYTKGQRSAEKIPLFLRNKENCHKTGTYFRTWSFIVYWHQKFLTKKEEFFVLPVFFLFLHSGRLEQGCQIV